MSAIVARGGRPRRPDRPTPADLVTGCRAVLVVACAVLVTQALPQGGSPPAAWWLVALAAVAWVLDGVDGYVARRTGTVSGRGALLDSAVDGTLVLVLSLAAAPRAPWALVGGLLYPVFLLVQVWRPAWRRALPHSRRRKLAGGMLTATLILGLAPVWPDRVVQVALGLAVALVTWSFLVDVRWLERAARG